MRTTYAGIACITLALVAVAPCEALGIASISLQSGTSPVTWSNAGTTDAFLVPDGADALTVAGTMQTTLLTGSGSITVTAPSSLTGLNGAPFNLSWVTVTCSGPAVGGQTYVANQTPLVAGGSITCATYASGFVSTTVKVTVNFFLDDRTLPADTYNSAAGAFGVVATAS